MMLFFFIFSLYKPIFKLNKLGSDPLGDATDQISLKCEYMRQQHIHTLLTRYYIRPFHYEIDP